ncbi:MAG: DsbC family protein [Gammaproteobacteria bacterium]|nr:DsbC family protein [Gammaproteobacteria bacterium]
MISKSTAMGGAMILGAVTLILPMSSAWADETPAVEPRLKAVLKGLLPDQEVTRVSPAPVPGLYEIQVGTEVLYMTTDGRYLIQGDMLDLTERRNLTEQKRSTARVQRLNEVPLADMIEFAPPSPKHVVYVFTDTQCGYCRRLHREMAEINRRGIAVRYLAFPRAGVGSPAFEQMESVWCAADRRQALTDAKLGKPVPSKTCASPVAREFALGEAIGVRGTPAIYTTDGRALPGYMPPDDLLAALQERAQQR